MNPAAARAFGVEAERALGRHFLEVVKSERLFQYLKETIESGEALDVDEEETFFSVERDGGPQHYQFVVTPVYTPSQAMIGAILLLRDVTKLKELDRLKSEFVATASHELKTPLTSIGMSIGLLEERAEEKLNERERALLAAASEDVERLKHLVNDLLDLSKIEAGKIELAFSAVPVPLLFRKAVQGLETQAEQQDVALVYEASEDLPDVKATPTRRRGC